MELKLLSSGKVSLKHGAVVSPSGEEQHHKQCSAPMAERRSSEAIQALVVQATRRNEEHTYFSMYTINTKSHDFYRVIWNKQANC